MSNAAASQQAYWLTCFVACESCFGTGRADFAVGGSLVSGLCPDCQGSRTIERDVRFDREPTLNEVLAVIGVTHRRLGAGPRHEYLRGDVVVFAGTVEQCWAWVHAGAAMDPGLAVDRLNAKMRALKKCRHDFSDGDVCSKCDAAKGAA